MTHQSNEIPFTPDIHIDDLTTADQDDWCQRLKENLSDPLEDIRQEHEGFLAELEALAVEALATGNWDKVFAHINQVRSTKVDLSDCFQSQEEYGLRDRIHPATTRGSQHQRFTPSRC